MTDATPTWGNPVTLANTNLAALLPRWPEVWCVAETETGLRHSSTAMRRLYVAHFICLGGHPDALELLSRIDSDGKEEALDPQAAEPGPVGVLLEIGIGAINETPVPAAWVEDLRAALKRLLAGCGEKGDAFELLSDLHVPCPNRWADWSQRYDDRFLRLLLPDHRVAEYSEEHGHIVSTRWAAFKTRAALALQMLHEPCPAVEGDLTDHLAFLVGFNLASGLRASDAADAVIAVLEGQADALGRMIGRLEIVEAEDSIHSAIERAMARPDGQEAWQRVVDWVLARRAKGFELESNNGQDDDQSEDDQEDDQGDDQEAQPTGTLPSTAAELDVLVNDYIEHANRGGFAPTAMSDQEVGAVFLELLGGAPPDAQQLGSFIATWSSGDDKLGGRVRMLAACGQLEQQILQHQKDNQISGLIREPFNFEPLDFTAERLRLGHWLMPLGDDPAVLRGNALELGRGLQRLASGRGSDWLTYRQIDFKPDDSIDAWRYNRDDWSEFDAALEAATHASISAGIPWIANTGDQALELILWCDADWPGCENGPSTTWVLVNPALAEKLDASDCWWA